MRRLCYNVAASLDGFIAGPNGEYDWIVMDPSIDFAPLFKRFDTAIMGRKSFEAALKHGQDGAMPGLDVVVFSKTLRQADHPKVKVINDDAATTVAALKEKSGKDIWLFGGGALFRSLLDVNLVDAIEVGLMPVVLGDGIPLVTSGSRSQPFRLAECKALPSGIVMLKYDLASAS
jgi:dihydrofolate reductase